MLKWIALVLSLLACGFYDFVQQRKLADMHAEIKIKQAELRPLAPFDAEVQVFQKNKDRLQRRIDLINQLKQNQHVPFQAVAMLAGEESAPIESAAVIPRGGLVINGRADSDATIEQLAQRLRATEKHVAPDHSFELQVTP
ncbi:MAG TPA: hypothetical protein VLV78_23500 [Thermoanaerobaculia bacterium]|nr:hypothetical protein [Thermoanaerobaculia bacterium]